MTTEIMQKIDNYLASSGVANASDNEDFFPGDSNEEVMCRHDPSPTWVRRYQTGGGYRGFNFAYYCKSAAVKTARQKLEAIRNALYVDNFTDLMGLDDGRLVVTQEPSPVSKDENGIVVYTSAYALEYKEEA